jgi:hypothetical protein
VIHFLLHERHFYTVGLYLERRAPELAPRVRLVSYAELARARSLPRGAWIFSDLDRLTGAELAFAARVHRALSGAGRAVRTLNDPASTLRRADLLRALHDAGINRFRAFPASQTEADCRFPVFVREANDHHGSLTPLLHSRRELRSAVRGLRVRGYRRAELLVVEFLDTRSPDGMYRKYAAFRVGEAVLARGLTVSPRWVVKQGDGAADAAWVEEERRYVLENPHADRLSEVFSLAGVEYGRVDYGLVDGSVQVWEINLNPTIGPSPRKGPRPPEHERLRPLREPARAHFYTRFADALRSLDEVEPGPDVRLPPHSWLRWHARLSAAGARTRARFAARVDRAWGALRDVGPVR